MNISVNNLRNIFYEFITFILRVQYCREDLRAKSKKISKLLTVSPTYILKSLLNNKIQYTF